MESVTGATYRYKDYSNNTSRKAQVALGSFHHRLRWHLLDDYQVFFLLLVALACVRTSISAPDL